MTRTVHTQMQRIQNFQREFPGKADIGWVVLGGDINNVEFAMGGGFVILDNVNDMAKNLWVIGKDDVEWRDGFLPSDFRGEVWA